MSKRRGLPEVKLPDSPSQALLSLFRAMQGTRKIYARAKPQTQQAIKRGYERLLVQYEAEAAKPQPIQSKINPWDDLELDIRPPALKRQPTSWAHL